MRTTRRELCGWGRTSPSVADVLDVSADELTGDLLSDQGASLGEDLGRIRVVLGGAMDERVRQSFQQDTMDHRILNTALLLGWIEWVARQVPSLLPGGLDAAHLGVVVGLVVVLGTWAALKLSRQPSDAVDNFAAAVGFYLFGDRTLFYSRKAK